MHKNVALLDVAHTLLFDNSLNVSSLEALKENRGSDTYLFTEMTYPFSFLAFSYLFFRFSSIRSSFFISDSLCIGRDVPYQNIVQIKYYLNL